MKPIRVTFDSNVWEPVVCPDPTHPQHMWLLEINEALRDRRLHGFICETVGTLEAITKPKRADYLAKRKFKNSVLAEGTGNNTNITITFQMDHNHPDLVLHPKLLNKLQTARHIDIRLLQVPVIGLPIPKYFRDNRDFYAPETFSSGYFDRFGNAAAAIEARGLGSALLTAIGKRIQQRSPLNAHVAISGVQWLQYAKDEAEKKEIAKAIAEWADGYLVASHIGYENDVLCTEDQAHSVRGASVFDTTNRTWLSATYGVTVLTIRQLAALMPPK
jgi:hypothetical protein